MYFECDYPKGSFYRETNYISCCLVPTWFAFALLRQFRVVFQTFKPLQTVCPGYFWGICFLLPRPAQLQWRLAEPVSLWLSGRFYKHVRKCQAVVMIHIVTRSTWSLIHELKDKKEKNNTNQMAFWECWRQGEEIHQGQNPFSAVNINPLTLKQLI